VVAAEDAGKVGVAERLGIEANMVVQEIGWDEDVDVVLLWWREDDGDLVDALMDAISPLADNGVIWVLTPKTGRAGHVEPSEIAEAVPTAGLAQTSTASVGDDWTAIRLVAPKSVKPKR
jgi:hypothetical protein